MALDDQRFERIRAKNPLRDYLSRMGVTVDPHGFFRCVSLNHADRTPSAKINPSDPDLWQCFGCGERGDIVDLVRVAQGLTLAEAANVLDDGDRTPPPPPREKPKLRLVRGEYGPPPVDAPRPQPGEPFAYWAESKQNKGEWSEKTTTFSDVYPYRDRDGTLHAYVLRRNWISPTGEPKKMLQPVRWNAVAKRFDAAGFAKGEARPLFNEDELARRREARVLVVEGEKCVRLAEALFPDMVAVTWISGGKNATNCDWSDLKGRHVTLWPDNDPPGIEAMATIAGLAQAQTTLLVPIAENWQPKWDIVDVAALHPGAAADALATAQPYRPDVSPKGRAGLWDHVSDGGWLPDDLDPIYAANSNAVKVDHDWNIELVLAYHPAFAKLQWDVLRSRIVWQGKPVEPDSSLGFMAGLLNRHAGLITNRGFIDTIETVARTRSVNTLAEQIRALTWDGTKRVEALWTYFGAGVASEWNIAGPKRWFLGLVNRILRPGAQSDLMLVLEGEQGIFKSTALKTLAEPFGYPGYVALSGFGSSATTNAADMMVLSGKLLVEMTEMTAHRRADQDYFKGMLTRTEDSYRSPYGRAYRDHPRTASFAGSTNRLDAYLTDETGGRRFVPIICDFPLDHVGLARDREQLYAEAADMLARTGAQAEQPYFSKAEEALQHDEIASRTAISLIRAQIEEAIENHNRDYITLAESWDRFGLSATPFAERMRLKPQIDAVLAELGWVWSDRIRTNTEDRNQRSRGWTQGTRRRGRRPTP